MEFSALMFMAGSWGFILSLLSYCLYKLMTAIKK